MHLKIIMILHIFDKKHIIAQHNILKYFCAQYGVLSVAEMYLIMPQDLGSGNLKMWTVYWRNVTSVKFAIYVVPCAKSRSFSQDVLSFFINLSNLAFSSVGRASDYRAGGLGFESQTGPTLRVVKWLSRIYCLQMVGKVVFSDKDDCALSIWLWNAQRGRANKYVCKYVCMNSCKWQDGKHNAILSSMLRCLSDKMLF